MNQQESAEPVPLGHGTQNGCFGCGDANATGLQLRFFLDAAGGVICRLQLAKRFQGPPGYAHGGVIATLLDEAMSKANRRRNIYAMTRHMSVEYLRPVPLETELVLEGHAQTEAGRKHRCTAALRDSEGRVLATASGLFIEVRPERLLDADKKPAPVGR
jgi:uncharacterized protein (TIGR00369 family)